MLPLLSDASNDSRPAALPARAPFVERRGQAPHLRAVPTPSPRPAAEGGLASGLQQGVPLGQVLDLLDYSLVLLGADGRVRHLNQAARRELAQPGHPLELLGDQLQARHAADAGALREAVHQATVRGLRRLLALGPGPQRSSVAVVPLAPTGEAGSGGHAVALLMARRAVCEQLTVEWFARSHGLTMAETTVLKGLCADTTPQQIATQQGVGLATVRTQIGSIRLKTGAASIPALMRQVALLPPLVGVLPGLALAGAAPMGSAPPRALHR